MGTKPEITMLLKVKPARDLITLLLDDCDMASDYIAGTTSTCFQFYDDMLWDGYSAFFCDIADLFLFYGVHEKAIEFIENWADTTKQLYISAGARDQRDMVPVFTEKFWNDMNNVCHLINANLYAIEKKQAV